MPNPINRIRDHLCGCQSRIRPAPPSLGDKLLSGAHRLKLEIWRCADGMTEMEYQLHGAFSTVEDEVEGDTISPDQSAAELRRMAAALLGEFTARREGGAA